MFSGGRLRLDIQGDAYEEVGSARCADLCRVQRRNAFAEGMNVVEKGSDPARAGRSAQRADPTNHFDMRIFGVVCVRAGAKSLNT